MRYELVFGGRTRKTLDGLDADLRNRLIRKLDALQENPRPTGTVKMAGLDDCYRIRMGDWRIVYEVRDKVLLVLVLRIAHRREVYR